MKIFYKNIWHLWISYFFSNVLIHCQLSIIMAKFFYIVLLYCLLPLVLSGQRYISGHITDAEDGGSIPFVTVFITNTTVGTTTDANGYYRLRIPSEGRISVGAFCLWKMTIPLVLTLFLNISIHNCEYSRRRNFIRYRHEKNKQIVDYLQHFYAGLMGFRILTIHSQ